MLILEIHNLTKRFGGITAVDNCSFEVEEGSIVGLIGPNGSGKTTLLNLIHGVYKADAGEIYFKKDRITGLRPDRIARKGIGRLFQKTSVFRKMTVLENMLVPVLHLPQKMELSVENALKLLKPVGLIDLRNEYAENLSGGQQRLLEFSRLLMLDPELVLLDEPFAAIHPEMKEKIINRIKEVHNEGKTFIIISHDMPSTMDICHKILVLNYGKLIAEGEPRDIQRDRRVIEAYLGV